METGTLFCPGPQGAGKTVISCIAADHLSNHFRNDDVGIAYIFCNYKKKEEQTLLQLSGSLLKQLVQQMKSIPDGLLKCYEMHLKLSTPPSIKEISDLLKNETLTFKKRFIIVDALDEFSDDNGSRSQLLKMLRVIQASQSMNLMATSRPIPYIMNEFQAAPTLEIRASDADVRRYLETQLTRLPHCVRKSRVLQRAIVDGIAGAIDGMSVTVLATLSS